MAEREKWAKIISRIVRAEMVKRDISYLELAKKLNEIKVPISSDDLRSRVSRGTFSAILFVQCMRVLGVKNLSFDESFFE